MRREGIKPPKFADQFARIDFEAEPLPVLCLYPIPEPIILESLKLSVCGLDAIPEFISWPELGDLPRVRMRMPIICQIFNWSEVVEWEGIRLADFLEKVGLDTGREGYYAFYSRDGHYFETLSRDEARDPRTLLAFGMNNVPLSLEYGAPLRLVVPFLQGYKSVKWVRAIRAFGRDPVGIKRLRGQSPGAQLSEEWRKRYGIALPDPKTKV